MSYKVGVKVNIKNEPQILWTLDGYSNDIRVFEDKDTAQAFGELVWPDNYVIEEVKELKYE